VYKAVPYNVVADWTQQGRLARTDKVRPSGTEEPWVAVADHDLLVDYLPRPSAAKAVSEAVATGTATSGEATATTTEEPVELPEPEPASRLKRPEDDDEVDMIPLIDISMVLLVFFIMIQAAGALAPVDVPEMKYAGQLSNDPEAITITIEKLNTEDVYYAVRVGGSPPKPSHDMLPTPAAAIAAVKECLGGRTSPPEVRIACRKDLPRKLVYLLRSELEPLRTSRLINNTVATVVEAPEK
jgi:hypothetical protein